MKNIRRTAAVLTTLGLLCGLAVAAGSAWAATEDDLAKVKIGMPRPEVLKIMGRPDKDQQVRQEDEDLCRLYVYKNVGRYKVVDIWFDCQDKVAAIDKAR